MGDFDTAKKKLSVENADLLHQVRVAPAGSREGWVTREVVRWSLGERGPGERGLSEKGSGEMESL